MADKIFDYCRENNAEGLLELLPLVDVNISAKNRIKDTLLHNAAANNSVECLKLLIEAGGDVNAKDNHRETPLHYASKNNSVECLKLLIEAGGDVNAKDGCIKTPLHNAIAINSADCLKLLIEAGGTESINTAVNYRILPLCYTFEIYYCTSLHYAISWESEECAKILLEAGADPNVPDSNGGTPLYYTVCFNRPKYFKLLMNYAGSININEHCIRGSTLLHVAAKENSCEVLQILIEMGADVNAKEYINGFTPLYSALIFNSENCFLRLIKAGADPNIRTRNGYNVYDVIFSYPAAFLRILIECDDCLQIINKKNNFRFTPLFIAAKNNLKYFLLLIIEAGADINEKDKKGKSFLDYITDKTLKEEMEEYVNEISTLNIKEPDC